LLPVAARAAEPVQFAEGAHGKGELKHIDGVPVLFLRGTPEEIGAQQGKLLSEPLEPILAFPRKFIDASGSQFAWPVCVLMSRTLMKHAPEDHRTELDAAIAASGKDQNTLYVANTLLELRRVGGCSTLVVEPQRSKTGALIFGRLFDFPTLGVLQHYSLVSVVQPEGKHAFMAIGFPGLNGVVSGMKEHGLAVATLDVFSSADESARFDVTGTPLAYTFRRILEECRTVAEAEALLRDSKRTRYMNLTVVDTETSAVFELTPETVAVRRSEDGLLSCTNHFRSEELCTGKNCRRFAALEQGRELKTLGVRDVASLLHEANQGPMTIQAMVFEPEAKILHLALGDGPVTANRFVRLSLADLLRADFSPQRRRDAEKGFEESQN
ncbi:MAG: C45 family autoproteolytic acyltransferase/hydrolase, partial [Planctomycetaceae bacterium]